MGVRGFVLQLLFPVMGVCCLDNLFFYYSLFVNCCEIVILSSEMIVALPARLGLQFHEMLGVGFVFVNMFLSVWVGF